jgi:hypothetical protein
MASNDIMSIIKFYKTSTKCFKFQPNFIDLKNRPKCDLKIFRQYIAIVWAE